MAATTRDVFINCPFDPGYQTFFQAVVFVVVRSGFRPRCARETDDSSENRFDKIWQDHKGMSLCGIHDISRTDVDRGTGLLRFNMPLELGVFLGAKRFGVGAQKSKRCIVLDKQKYRFQKYISDISGQDIHSHQGKLKILIEELATWLRSQSRDPKVPGGRRMVTEFALFRRKIPKICANRSLEPDELTFGDYAEMVAEYLAVTA